MGSYQDLRKCTGKKQLFPRIKISLLILIECYLSFYFKYYFCIIQTFKHLGRYLNIAIAKYAMSVQNMSLGKSFLVSNFYSSLLVIPF